MTSLWKMAQITVGTGRVPGTACAAAHQLEVRDCQGLWSVTWDQGPAPGLAQVRGQSLVPVTSQLFQFFVLTGRGCVLVEPPAADKSLRPLAAWVMLGAATSLAGPED